MPPNASLVTKNHTQAQSPLRGTGMKLKCYFFEKINIVIFEHNIKYGDYFE
jgi:hypothetical protein